MPNPKGNELHATTINIAGSNGIPPFGGTSTIQGSKANPIDSRLPKAQFAIMGMGGRNSNSVFIHSIRHTAWIIGKILKFIPDTGDERQDTVGRIR